MRQQQFLMVYASEEKHQVGKFRIGIEQRKRFNRR
jgi:hypothetical protein